MKKIPIFALASCLSLVPALAGRAIDESVDASADGEVSIELIAGEVHVIGWDRYEVQVSGTVGDDVEEVEVTSRGDRVSIEVKLQDDDGSSRGRSFHDAGAELEIRVPAGSAVEVEGISADITIEGVRGAVELETISGEIEVEGSMREAEVATVSGDIVIRSAAALGEGDFESVSGDIELDAALDGGDFSFATVSGDITLRLPGSTSAEFDIETFSGRIENELGPEVDSDDDGPGKELEFSIGGGEARVEVESFSGRIRLLRD